MSKNEKRKEMITNDRKLLIELSTNGLTLLKVKKETSICFSDLILKYLWVILERFLRPLRKMLIVQHPNVF